MQSNLIDNLFQREFDVDNIIFCLENSNTFIKATFLILG